MNCGTLGKNPGLTTWRLSRIESMSAITVGSLEFLDITAQGAASQLLGRLFPASLPKPQLENSGLAFMRVLKCASHLGFLHHLGTAMLELHTTALLILKEWSC